MIRHVVPLALLVSLFVGCQPAPPTPTQPSDPDNEKTRIHIHTPRVKVDVNPKGTDRAVDVEVHPTTR